MLKGIILAGGAGTRLYPITKAVIKQLLPVYDKPMVYYPMSVQIDAGIRDILIISTPDALPNYQKLFGDGSQLGLRIVYTVQEKPRGLADAFIVGEAFIGSDSVCLILGDNIFHSASFHTTLREVAMNDTGAYSFGYPVEDCSGFGVYEFDGNGNVISIEEKPKCPKSHYAVPGLYFYDNDVVGIAKTIEVSDRGELEITAVNNEYIKRGTMKVKLLGRKTAWFDCGSPKALFEATEYVKAIQTCQCSYVGCIEETAWRNGLIDLEQLMRLGNETSTTDYGQYILSLGKDGFQ